MIWNKMGIAYEMMFNLKDAARCFKASLKLDPHNAIVLNNMGTVYDSLKDYKRAERMYRRALRYSPRSALILKNLGTNLIAQHKYDKGWAAYQRAVGIDPEIFAGSRGPKTQNPASIQQRGAMNYYMALGCARAGYTDCALQYLRMALAEGFTTAKKLAREDDFVVLRNNPAFQQLLTEQKEDRHP
jgi:tetratricopeptide (TPR) repeat protein